MEGVKIIAQGRLDLGKRALARFGAQQPTGKTMEAVRDRIVVARDAHELSKLLLKRRMTFAHDFDLALDERDRRAAARVRQTQPRQQCLMALKEFRVVLQIA